MEKISLMLIALSLSILIGVISSFSILFLDSILLLNIFAAVGSLTLISCLSFIILLLIIKKIWG